MSLRLTQRWGGPWDEPVSGPLRCWQKKKKTCVLLCFVEKHRGESGKGPVYGHCHTVSDSRALSAGGNSGWVVLVLSQVLQRPLNGVFSLPGPGAPLEFLLPSQLTLFSATFDPAVL